MTIWNLKIKHSYIAKSNIVLRIANYIEMYKYMDPLPTMKINK